MDASRQEGEYPSEEVNVQEEQPKKNDRWFVAPDKYAELAIKPASRSATYEAQKDDDTELIFFTFPRNFDLKSLKGQSINLPTKKMTEVALEGQMKVNDEGETVAESCVIKPTKAMEYTHVVSIFPTGDTNAGAAHWMVGKPFSAGYTIATTATLKAKTSACCEAMEAASEAKAKAAEAEMEKKSKRKLAVKRSAKVTAVQGYGVGVKDTILGEETDGNRTIDVVPLESLWSRWTAVGGTKRSREEQQKQQQLSSSSKNKKAKKTKSSSEEDMNDDDKEEDEVEIPKKKKARKEKN